MQKQETIYCLPSYWKAWWYRPLRKYWLQKWRKAGFVAYLLKCEKRFVSYKPIPRHERFRLKQGLVMAYVERVRRRGALVVTKPILTNDFLRESVT